MRELLTKVEVDASAAAVWDVLTDIRKHSQWNTFMDIKGLLEVGQTLDVRANVSRLMVLKFRPKVISVAPERELRWKGGLPIGGLYDGEHSFELTRVSEQRTLLVQREVYRGILVPVIFPVLERNLRKGFEGMNAALKRYVEACTSRET